MGYASFTYHTTYADFLIPKLSYEISHVFAINSNSIDATDRARAGDGDGV